MYASESIEPHNDNLLISAKLSIYPAQVPHGDIVYDTVYFNAEQIGVWAASQPEPLCARLPSGTASLPH